MAFIIFLGSDQGVAQVLHEQVKLFPSASFDRFWQSFVILLGRFEIGLPPKKLARLVIEIFLLVFILVLILILGFIYLVV